MLIVDDELHAIEGIQEDLSLEQLNISELYTAFNVKQAKEVFKRAKINILLCDIEMPQGNGLELLEWVKEYSPHTETIFLTSHAEFKYAKEALRLGCHDYLLKPVMPDELEEIIKKVQKVIDKNGEINRNSHSHQLWLKNQSLIIERFWHDLINYVTPSNTIVIREQIEQLHLPITEQMFFIPILFTVKKWNKDLSDRDKKILEYALKNTANEIILGEHTNGLFFYLDEGMLLGILTADEQITQEQQLSLNRLCESYIQSCNHFFYCDMSGYIGKYVEAKDIANLVNHLKRQDQHNIAFYNKVFSYKEFISVKNAVELPDNKMWYSLLKSRKKDNILQVVKGFIQRLLDQRMMDVQTLHRLHQDLLQSLYLFLHESGIQAQQLFGDDHSRLLSQEASHSVEKWLTWLEYAVGKAINQLEKIEKTDSVVDYVKQYIDTHIDQELSRESIAELVFINPDHLTRIFKKATGYSISDYIFHERMRVAKDLLINTNIPIGTVASSVGHISFSHFSRIFKKHAGLGPSEFRAKYKETIH